MFTVSWVWLSVPVLLPWGESWFFLHVLSFPFSFYFQWLHYPVPFWSGDVTVKAYPVKGGIVYFFQWVVGFHRYNAEDQWVYFIHCPIWSTIVWGVNFIRRSRCSVFWVWCFPFGTNLKVFLWRQSHQCSVWVCLRRSVFSFTWFSCFPFIGSRV